MEQTTTQGLVFETGEGRYGIATFKLHSEDGPCISANLSEGTLRIENIFKCSSTPGSARRSIFRLVKYVKNEGYPVNFIELTDIATVDNVYLSDIELLKTGHSFYGKMGLTVAGGTYQDNYNENIAKMSSLVMSSDIKTVLAKIFKKNHSIVNRIYTARSDMLVGTLMRELFATSEVPKTVIQKLIDALGLASMVHATYFMIVE
jgi:hypothetical protein